MLPRNPEQTAKLAELFSTTYSFRANTAMDLVRQGADPNDPKVRDASGNLLLHKLVRGNERGEHDQFIEELVQTHGADINLKNGNKKTALQVLISSNKATKDAIIKLVNLGADPLVKDVENNTLLYGLLRGLTQLSVLAKKKKVDYDWIAAGCDRITEVITLLVNTYLIDLDSQNSKKDSFLMSLIRELPPALSKLDVIKRLKSLGAKFDLLGAEDMTLLHAAAASDDTAVGEYLLAEHQADLEAKNNTGETPLYTACAKGNLAFATCQL